MRAKQPLLGIVVSKRSAAQSRFEAETLRRGGPYEVMGRRRRKADQPAPVLTRTDKPLGKPNWDIIGR